MRPCLKPALRRAWRDAETLQFGVRPEHTRLLRPAVAELAVLDLLDGTRELPALAAEARRLGVSVRRVRGLLGELRGSGLLDDAGARQPLRAECPPPELARLEPDLASLSLVHPAPGAGAAAMLARRTLRVEVRGAGRVGAGIAAVLAAAGVGLVQPQDGGRVLAEDVSPAGLRPEDVGRPRAAAARAAVRRAAPGHPDDTGAARRTPDLVVVAPRGDATGLTADPELGAELLAAGVPHLYAGVAETSGTVGPLVVPGRSPCGRCVALHRTDTDPHWPRVLAQHRAHRTEPPAACDTALATTVAGTAALHALIFLDGGAPPSLGGWVDVSGRDGSMRRLRLTPHQDCGCCPLPVPSPARPPAAPPAGALRSPALRVQNDREHRVPKLEEK